MTDLEIIDYLIDKKIVQQPCLVNSVCMVFTLIMNMDKEIMKMIHDLPRELIVNSKNELIIDREKTEE